jgi:PIN domain nuclease of toxin-antitoxin system
VSDLNVLDASAVLALLQAEKGQDVVRAAMIARRSRISTVNYSEVIAKLCEHGVPPHDAQLALDVLSIELVAFDQRLALETAFLKAGTKSIGASLGDRACLALASACAAPDIPVVYTAEKQWLKVKWPFKVILIR